jgi:hypothetical protein
MRGTDVRNELEYKRRHSLFTGILERRAVSMRHG